jgi:ferredoxin--NADP+ reductase
MDDQFLFSNNVIGLKEIANEKYCLTFKKQFGYKAGQVVQLTCNRSIEPRLYSLCSGEFDQQMEILFDLKLGGELTPKLIELKPGDRLYVSHPYGQFLRPTQEKMWWIATGTGIAPFRSMMRSGYEADKILHGARQEEQFYFSDEFKTAFGEKYVRCNSSTIEAGDFQGRVTNYIESLKSLPKDIKYYLCGRSMMVVEVRDLLIARGVPFENILSEIFF